MASLTVSVELSRQRRLANNLEAAVGTASRDRYGGLGL